MDNVSSILLMLGCLLVMLWIKKAERKAKIQIDQKISINKDLVNMWVQERELIESQWFYGQISYEEYENRIKISDHSKRALEESMSTANHEVHIEIRGITLPIDRD